MAAFVDCFKYNFALVSRVANSFAENSSFDLRVGGQKVNIDRARREHEELVETLRRIGLDVIELPVDEKHPDALFVDDVAIVIHGTALMCNPPTFKDRPSRQGEVLLSFFCYTLFLRSPVKRKLFSRGGRQPTGITRVYRNTTPATPAPKIQPASRCGHAAAE